MVAEIEMEFETHYNRGIAYREMGYAVAAIDHFLTGLNAGDLTAQAELVLRYEIAATYESMALYRVAARFYRKVEALDATYRDVGTRLTQVRRLGSEQKPSRNIVGAGQPGDRHEHHQI